MPTHAGPNIVESGLLLHFDAADINSYPGSGTVWTDLVNGYQLTAQGNPTFNGKGFTFDGNGDYFISSGIPNTTTDGVTLIAVCKPTTISRRHYVADIRYNEPGVTTEGAAIGFDSNGTVFNFARDSTGFDETSGPSTYLTGNTYFIGIRRAPSSTSIEVLDSDNNTWISPTLSSDGLSTGSIGVSGLIIGNYANPSNTYTFIGDIYSVMVYNRYLTDQETLQNFNATKTRFNL